MTRDQVIQELTNRFLGWKLPANFNPDCGISFKAEYNDDPKVMEMLGIDKPSRHEPVGTNLFDYSQAKAMIEYLLAGADIKIGVDF